MKNQILSDRLKIARENIGITKAEAARRLNLSKIGYCRYEYGERTPSMQTLEVIARCFNTSVDYLLGESDNAESDQIVICKSENPVLFELVKLCQEQNQEQLNRLLAYSKKATQF